MQPGARLLRAEVEVSRFPRRRFPYMPRSLTPRAGPNLTNSGHGRCAFCGKKRMGFPENKISTLYRLACTYPCQRFVVALADGHA